MNLRQLFSPSQIQEDELSHRGRKLAPGFYWVGFRDSGYRRQVVRGLIGLSLFAAIKFVA